MPYMPTLGWFGGHLVHVKSSIHCARSIPFWSHAGPGSHRKNPGSHRRKSRCRRESCRACMSHWKGGREIEHTWMMLRVAMPTNMIELALVVCRCLTHIQKSNDICMIPFTVLATSGCHPGCLALVLNSSAKTGLRSWWKVCHWSGNQKNQSFFIGCKNTPLCCLHAV